MPVRPSSGAEIRQLIDALGSADDVTRESAVARLAVIGPRAVEHLLQEFPVATGRRRDGMLRAFEAAGDPRALPAARASLEDPSAAVQTAAIGVLRTLLGAQKPAVARDALDLLIAIALDRRRIAEVRLSAFDALAEVPADVREPVRGKSGGGSRRRRPDPSDDVRRSGGRRQRPVEERRGGTAARVSGGAEASAERAARHRATHRIAAPRGSRAHP